MGEYRAVVPISFKALERVLGFQGVRIVGTVSTTPQSVAGGYLEIVVEGPGFPMFEPGQTLARYHAKVHLGPTTSFAMDEYAAGDGEVNMSQDY